MDRGVPPLAGLLSAHRSNGTEAIGRNSIRPSDGLTSPIGDANASQCALPVRERA